MLPIDATIALGAGWETPGWALAVLALTTLLSLLVAALTIFARRAASSEERADDARHGDLHAGIARTENGIDRLGKQTALRFDRLDIEIREVRRDHMAIDRRVTVLETIGGSRRATEVSP